MTTDSGSQNSNPSPSDCFHHDHCPVGATCHPKDQANVRRPEGAPVNLSARILGAVWVRTGRVFSSSPGFCDLLGPGDFGIVEEAHIRRLDHAQFCFWPLSELESRFPESAPASLVRALTHALQSEHEQKTCEYKASVRERVARTLSRIHRRFGELPKGLSRAEWAQLAGIAMESFVRQLKDFKEEGLISVDSTDPTIIMVLSPDGLVRAGGMTQSV